MKERAPWRELLLLLPRSPPENLLPALSVPATQSATQCQNRVGTYAARSCDGAEVRCAAAFCWGKPNSGSGTGKTMKSWREGERLKEGKVNEERGER